MSKWLYKLENKFRRFGIDNLMIYVTGTMLAVFLVELITNIRITELMYLDRALILQGQVWRLITFAFIPEANSVFWILLSLYFFYFIGSSLENVWGSTRFTIFYIIGIIGAIIAAMISGFGTNMYLNMSLFLAFAILFPNYEIMLFFVLPVKVKYLAYIDAAVLLYLLVVNTWSGRAAIIASFLHIILFFGDILINKIKDYKRYGKQRREFRRKIRKNRDMYGN